MFDSITIRPWAPFLNPRLDLGEIAESLLFYGNVDLVLDESQLTQLVQKAGLNTTLALVEGGHARVMLLPEIPATQTTGPPGSETFDFITVQKARGDHQLMEPQDFVAEALFRATQRKGESKRAAQRFLGHSSILRLSDPRTNKSDVCDLSRQDVRDTEYVHLAIHEGLMAITGEPPPQGWRFEVIPSGNRLRVFSNLNYEVLSARGREHLGAELQMTSAHLLDLLHAARVDLYLSSLRGSELLTNEVSSKLICHRLRNAFRVASTNQVGEIDLFQSVVLNGHRLGDAIRSGHKTLDQFLKLRDRAQRFRSWVAEQPPDSSLLSEYYASVTRGSWVEQLPAKVLRFLTFMSLGIAVDSLVPTGISTGLSVAVGAADAFLVDRIVKGWNPSQFVNRQLRPFLDGKETPPKQET